MNTGSSEGQIIRIASNENFDSPRQTESASLKTFSLRGGAQLPKLQSFTTLQASKANELQNGSSLAALQASDNHKSMPYGMNARNSLGKKSFSFTGKG